MELSLLRRRRIPLLFLLGVGIPSLALSYLAFRGIRNELALLGQRRLSEHRALAEFVNETIDQHIATAEETFFSAVAPFDAPGAPDLVRSLERLQERYRLVDEVFYLKGLETIQLPVADLLFYRDGGLPSVASAWPASAAEHMRTGQQREFQENRYRAALTSYQRAFAAVSDPVLKGEVLVAIARAQRKARRFDAALASCETLYRDYGQVRTTAGVPLGPMARLEHGSLLLTTGDSAAALDGYIELYERLVAGEWTLERAQFDFFRGQARETIVELTSRAPAAESPGSYHEVIASLAAEEAARRERTERLLLFQATIAEDLRARVRREPQGPATSGNRYTLESGGQTYLVSVLGRGTPEGGSWGLLLDAGYLSDHLLRRALEDQVDPSTTDWIVRGRDGRTVLARDGPPQSSLTVNATFAGNFPPWLIEFYQRPQNPYRRLFASSQSIYVYMFLLIASILVFGLILTIRAVTHELELAKLKSDFVSTVSHEFKSPLTSIRQLAEMLQAGRVPSDERRQRYYDVLVEQSGRLSSLVTNILDIARIEEGRKEFEFETVDVGELVEEVVSAAEHQWRHEGFVIHADVNRPLPAIHADRASIGQAVSNLIDNAVKYSGDSREVHVRASAADGQVKISVQDFGVGIKEEDLGRVFERFYRGGDELTRSVKGSGLGLTLVVQIVEAHNGTVYVESEVGQGSTFSITLPVSREQGDAEDSDH
jgi:signal transduction histidine kinase